MKNNKTNNIIVITTVILFFSIFVGYNVFATTPNPGHPWTDVGDGTFSVTGPTALRTFSFPDANATVLTENSLVTIAQGGLDRNSIAQGDILYGSAVDTLSALGKDTNATRYLSNTGTSNNPAWAQIDLTNGVTGILGGSNGGTGNGFLTFSGPTTSTKTFTLPDTNATILTDNAPVTLAQGGTGASLTASVGGILYSNGSTGALLSGTVTAGQVIRSGANSAPSWSTATYPSTAGSAGKILRSDGTNFVASTGTYPDTAGTAGNILISDGTNFSSTAQPDQMQFTNIGLYASSISAFTARSDGDTYFQYVGVAPKAYSSCSVLLNVTAGISFPTWQEVAVFKGAPVANSNASLTLLGYTAVSFSGSPGRVVTSVSLSGTSVGDQLWVAYGSKSSTASVYQVRGTLADDIQSGTFQIATVRPSLASSPQATTLAGATVVPGWVSMSCS